MIVCESLGMSFAAMWREEGRSVAVLLTKLG